MQTLTGIRIIQSPPLTETVLYPRSPGRAARRIRRGFPQHYATRPRKDALRLPDGTVVMHPATYAALVAMVAAQARTL